MHVHIESRHSLSSSDSCSCSCSCSCSFPRTRTQTRTRTLGRFDPICSRGTIALRCFSAFLFLFALCVPALQPCTAAELSFRVLSGAGYEHSDLVAGGVVAESAVECQQHCYEWSHNPSRSSSSPPCTLWSYYPSTLQPSCFLKYNQTEITPNLCPTNDFHCAISGTITPIIDLVIVSGLGYTGYDIYPPYSSSTKKVSKDSPLLCQQECYDWSISSDTNSIPCTLWSFYHGEFSEPNCYLKYNTTEVAPKPCPDANKKCVTSGTIKTLDCSAGYFVNVSALSTQNASCVMCSKGTWSRGGASSTCTPCPDGTTTPEVVSFTGISSLNVNRYLRHDNFIVRLSDEVSSLSTPAQSTWSIVPCLMNLITPGQSIDCVSFTTSNVISNLPDYYLRHISFRVKIDNVNFNAGGESRSDEDQILFYQDASFIMRNVSESSIPIPAGWKGQPNQQYVQFQAITPGAVGYLLYYDDYGDIILKAPDNITTTEKTFNNTIFQRKPPAVVPSGRDSCRACPAGTYKNSTSGVCVACPTGSSSIPSRTSCIWCDPGSYAYPAPDLILGVGSTTCAPCNTGSYSNTQGATICQSCLFNQYQNNTGETICNKCAQGTCSAGGATQCTKQECQLGCRMGDAVPFPIGVGTYVLNLNTTTTNIIITSNNNTDNNVIVPVGTSITVNCSSGYMYIGSNNNNNNNIGTFTCSEISDSAGTIRGGWTSANTTTGTGTGNESIKRGSCIAICDRTLLPVPSATSSPLYVLSLPSPPSALTSSSGLYAGLSLDSVPSAPIEAGVSLYQECAAAAAGSAVSYQHQQARILQCKEGEGGGGWNNNNTPNKTECSDICVLPPLLLSNVSSVYVSHNNNKQPFIFVNTSAFVFCPSGSLLWGLGTLATAGTVLQCNAGGVWTTNTNNNINITTITCQQDACAGFELSKSGVIAVAVDGVSISPTSIINNTLTSSKITLACNTSTQNIQPSNGVVQVNTIFCLKSSWSETPSTLSCSIPTPTPTSTPTPTPTPTPVPTVIAPSSSSSDSSSSFIRSSSFVGILLSGVVSLVAGAIAWITRSLYKLRATRAREEFSTANALQQYLQIFYYDFTAGDGAKYVSVISLLMSHCRSLNLTFGRYGPNVHVAGVLTDAEQKKYMPILAKAILQHIYLQRVCRILPCIQAPYKLPLAHFRDSIPDIVKTLQQLCAIPTTATTTTTTTTSTTEGAVVPHIHVNPNFGLRDDEFVQNPLATPHSPSAVSSPVSGSAPAQSHADAAAISPRDIRVNIPLISGASKAQPSDVEMTEMAATLPGTMPNASREGAGVGVNGCGSGARVGLGSGDWARPSNRTTNETRDGDSDSDSDSEPAPLSHKPSNMPISSLNLAG